MLNITIPNNTNKHMFWFYFRKGFFQIFLPIVLGFVSICDYMSQTDNVPSKSYHHIYFYTLIILFFHTSVKYIMKYIFSLCADNILFNKKINTDNNISYLQLPDNLTDTYHFITIKKIFKLRYSNNKLFTRIASICWYTGLDCPIIIPIDIVNKFINLDLLKRDDTEYQVLHSVLTQIQNYKPKIYHVKPINSVNSVNSVSSVNPLDKSADSIGSMNLPELIDPINDLNTDNSQFVITKIDKNICDMQFNLFNIKSDINNSPIGVNIDP